MSRYGERCGADDAPAAVDRRPRARSGPRLSGTLRDLPFGDGRGRGHQDRARRKGDMMRKRARDGDYPFRALNGCKRSVVLNLKSDKGKGLLLELSRSADVLVENFAPMSCHALGLGPDAFLAVNPRLIYASASGFGRTGPYAEKLALDLTIRGHGRADEHDRCQGRPAAQGRRAGRRFHVRRPFLRRDRDRAFRARGTGRGRSSRCRCWKRCSRHCCPPPAMPIRAAIRRPAPATATSPIPTYRSMFSRHRTAMSRSSALRTTTGRS